MRIIAGKYRSRKLITLDGIKTRPTLDKTKEAIFSSMGNYLNDKIILDIFGGSGALSIESISRGAKRAYIFDSNIEAIRIIKTNAQNLNIQEELIIWHIDYLQGLEKLKSEKFDIIFIDPPFRMKVIDEIIEYIIKHDMINSGGYIVAEYPRDDVINKIYNGYRLKLCRFYSSSEVIILEKE